MEWQSAAIDILRLKAITIVTMTLAAICATCLWRLCRGMPVRQADDWQNIRLLFVAGILISILSLPNDHGERFGIHGIWTLVATLGLGAIVVAIAYPLDLWFKRRAEAPAPPKPSQGNEP